MQLTPAPARIHLLLLGLGLVVQRYVLAEAPGMPRVRVDPATHFFVDTSDRVRVFHGVNVVEKLPPFLPVSTGFDARNSLSEADILNLSSWGLNAVRLGVLWAGVMPQEGWVNATYLRTARSFVRALAARGIYTLVDMHQDSMGARYCGEGFPEWAVQKALRLSGMNVSAANRFPKPFHWDMRVDPSGLPSREACSAHDFLLYYGTTEASAAREAFFKDMHADFAAHWAAVASALRDETSVLGYELFNEPFSRSPGASDRRKLLPLYQAAHEAIRAHDQRAIVFFEPHVLNGQFGLASDFPHGGPGGELYNDRQAFAYHIYCQNGTSTAVGLALCNVALRTAWGSFRANNARLGGGRMLTEFGAVSDSPHALRVLRKSLDLADAHMQSWTYWSFKPYDDITTNASPLSEGLYYRNGTLQRQKLAELSRPYAPLISGKPIAWHYDADSLAFTLRYVCGSSAAPTVIFAHKAFHFPHGVCISISPSEAARWEQPSENVVEVWHQSSSAGAEVEVAVSQRAAASTCLVAPTPSLY